MKIDIQKIEDRLRDFFERDLHVLSQRDPFHRLTEELVKTMEANLIHSGKKVYAPNIYRVTLNRKIFVDKDDLREWKATVEEVIREVIRENALQMAGPLHIQLFFESRMIPDFEISISNSAIPSGKTVNMVKEDTPPVAQETLLEGYLIGADEHYFAIEKAIITIGRREDNDLVIDNLRVSRVHAQIRQLSNRHVIFDLDSTTGTKVNGIKIRQHTLNTGDVIEIAETPIIYVDSGEMEQPGAGKNKTRMLSSRMKTNQKI